jgi:site-specific recombinase XerD
MNPEIAAARTAQADKKKKQMSALEAATLYINRRELDDCHSTRKQYRSVLGWVDDEEKRRGKLLKALDEAGIEHIQGVDTRWLATWYQGEEWDGYSQTTRKQRWTIIRMFFEYLFEAGINPTNPALPIRSAKGNGHYNNIPFTPEQYGKILKAAESDRRMYIFIELLRWSGMDLEDAIQFEPVFINKQGVLTYYRQKTHNRAVIPLEPHLIPLLQSIPLPEGCNAEMPFRRQSVVIETDHVLWYSHVKALFAEAGVTELRMRQKDGVNTVKAPTPKSFRHTFAVHYLSLGLSVADVAAMLGHTKSSTTEAYYLPWVPQREEAHINKVREAQAAAGKKKLPAVDAAGVSASIQ